MWWMYGGFVAALYLALGAWAAVVLPSHSMPTRGAMAFFVLIPLMAIGISAQPLAAASPEDRKRVRRALDDGLLARRHAFAAGLVAGAITMGAIALTWRACAAARDSSASLGVALVLITLELIVFPALGAAYLVELSKRRLARRGQEEICHSAGPGVSPSKVCPHCRPQDCRPQDCRPQDPSTCDAG